MKRLILLAVFGLLLEGTFAAIAIRPAERDALAGTIMLQFAAGLLYLSAAAVALGIPGAARRGGAYGAIIALSVVFRLTLVLAPPSLSTDIWRYVWEGRVERAGKNPYRLAPDAAELAPLRDADWERVEHKEVPAVYGPLAELTFLLGSPRALKGLYALADLAVLALVTRLLKRRALPSSLALLYGWHPLAVIEVAGEGHLDALGVALLVLALDAVESRRERLAGIALGLAAAVKFLPFVLLPAFVRRAGVRATAVALVVFAAFLLPFGVPRGLERYATEWRFSATGIVAVEEVLERTGAETRLARALAGDDELAQTTPYDKAPQRLVAGALVALVALAAVKLPLDAALVATIGAVLALSPVVHPWYLLWLLPLACVRRSLAFLQLTLAVPVVYVVLLGYDGTPASWHEEAWPRVLVLVPFAGLFIWENVRHGKRVPGAP